MKKYLVGALAALLAVSLLAACGQKETDAKTPPAEIEVPISLTLTAEEHPELDFGTAVDGGPAIRDYCFTSEGTLFLLQLSGPVFEYDLAGNLIGQYDLDLEKKGLTAYRIAAGTDGTFYLLDGHNNGVITATREGVDHFSEATFTDVGLVMKFFSDGKGSLIISYLDEEARRSLTTSLDVSGDTILPGQTLPGVALMGELTTDAQFVNGNDRASDEAIRFTLYAAGEKKESGVITRQDGRPLGGFLPLGLLEGKPMGMLLTYMLEDDGREWLEMVHLRLDGETVAVGTSDLRDDEAIRYLGETAFFLRRGENALTIAQLSTACTDWTETTEYLFTAE